ncbi:unnamed protein product [Schistocephalus solidus]|uniref:VPS13 domain-containing protein n=1 Tax=Schistocephalus solidus TaxID=70667 RepID=A0A183SRB8_SCHSO|nr:unnamed protein product [Schistocephalus solidus]
MREMYASDSSSWSWHLTSSSSLSYDDSDAEISSADKKTSWMAMVSDVAANKSTSTPTIEEEPMVREALSSWAICSRIPLIHLSSPLKKNGRLNVNLPADARTRLGGASDVSTLTAMGSSDETLVNDRLKSLNAYLPREFSQRARSFTDFDAWKAPNCVSFVVQSLPFDVAVDVEDLLDPIPAEEPYTQMKDAEINRLAKSAN